LEPSKVVVVLAGAAHVRGVGGIPDKLGDLPFKIILPPFPGFSDESISTKDINYLLEEPFSILKLSLAIKFLHDHYRGRVALTIFPTP
jgi:hypothetical protein